MLPNSKNRILSLDPSTREMGFAVLEEEELLFWGVTTLKRGKRRSRREVLARARRCLLRLIRNYEPDLLVVEEISAIRASNSSLLNVLVEEMKAAAQERGLKVFELAPTQVKERICGTGKTSKKEVVRKVALRYPELQRYLSPKGSWREKYWARMFWALALGLAWWLKNREFQ